MPTPPLTPTWNDSEVTLLKKLLVNTAEIATSGISGGDVTFTKVTTPTVAAATSAGLVLEAANGTDAIIVGPGNTANVTFLGNATVPSGYTMTSAGAINLSAGAPITLTQASVSSATFPPLNVTRTTALTNVPASAQAITFSTSGDAADGFGPSVSFRISDNAVTNSDIGGIAYVRAGADNTGDFVVRPNTTGTQAERFRVVSSGQVNVAVGVATPAGGSTAARLIFGSTAGFGIYIGSGAPTVSAAQGSLYLRSDGSSATSRAYLNTNGSTTWTAITTSA